ncbi:hypothetical protein CWE08_04835 [Aliidiomarina iranensis]|uniref:Uncharacterized protein n=1 Tax=Aliidiomarina iranensis TaxID=1434071 RepID=A0A432W0G6_9GAMM|nr:hypothetical protein [Aliidiomarina iranensis]RUO22506.1 hypothetical protein CWE08_04835 [Aliidiomarina iranensis]
MVMRAGQSEIFNPVGFDSQFAELCNALYAAELLQLSEPPGQSAHNDIGLLRRRLGSLSYYVQRAAHALLASANKPGQGLQLDVHSAAWLAKQKLQPPTENTPDKLCKWLGQHAVLALPLPVWVKTAGVIRVCLDSIDEVDIEAQRLHLNQFGWFDFHGNPKASDLSADVGSLRLLLPSKNSITAACCGHQWNASGRIQPHALSLRTLLLTATVQWPKFTGVDKLPF